MSQYSATVPYLESRRLNFLGVPFDPIGADEVLAGIAARQPDEPFRYVVTPNVDHVVRLSQRPHLRSLYEGAWLSVCDSQPVRALARRRGLELPLVTGSDLSARVFHEIIQPGDRICLVAAHDGLQPALQLAFPGVEFVIHVPPMGFINDSEAVLRAAHFVVSSRARYTFLGVGSPQSELLAAQIAAMPGACGTALCTGAALEFLVGHKQRAPLWMRSHGLEWLHRMASEPRRLTRRYLGTALPLLALYFRDRGVAAQTSGGRRVPGRKAS